MGTIAEKLEAMSTVALHPSESLRPCHGKRQAISHVPGWIVTGPSKSAVLDNVGAVPSQHITIGNGSPCPLYVASMDGIGAIRSLPGGAGQLHRRFDY